MSDNEVNEELRRYQKQKEEKIQEFAKSMMNKMPLFIAIGIAIFWIFYGTVEIIPTNLSIVERIGLTICTIVLAVTYCNLIADGGFKSARESIEYETADKEYEQAQKDGKTEQLEITEYAKDIAKDNLRECRARNLDLNGLKYRDYFDIDGNYIGNDYKLNKLLRRKQKKTIKKCINLRIIIPNIFGNLSSKFFGLKKEVTQKDYKRKDITMQTIIRTVLSFFSVGMMFNFLGFSWGSAIYALFQIVLWSASGFSQRLKNYNFVKDILVPQMKEKTLIINGYLALDDNRKVYYQKRVEDVKHERLIALGLVNDEQKNKEEFLKALNTPDKIIVETKNIDSSEVELDGRFKQELL